MPLKMYAEDDNKIRILKSEILNNIESTTTRKAGGLDFPVPMGGERQKHVCALIVAVVTGCIAPGLKTTNHTS